MRKQKEKTINLKTFEYLIKTFGDIKLMDIGYMDIIEATYKYLSGEPYPVVSNRIHRLLLEAEQERQESEKQRVIVEDLDGKEELYEEYIREINSENNT